jgi:ATP-dependent Lhr-like helicase
MAPKPLDILAQQLVAEVACEEWDEDALYDLVRNAYPYRDLTPEEFAEVVQMVARGFTTRRGRRGALIHYDGVHRRLRARRGSRLTAITAGGAIPDNADYRVVLEPDETFLGTVNEDFAVESMAGDVFQLGNAAWRILQVNSGTVRVADAAGEMPSIPFWFGEAPGRSDELSAAVAALRSEMEARLDDPDATTRWLVEDVELPQPAAHQLSHYLADARAMLGILPTQETIVLERFFDESGGMQLVLHAPFGSRINKAWGLALRKRFCRQFNFELQAAATENGLLLSLGPQHSFPLDDVFRYLHPDRVRDILVQALFDAPVFQTRWRWNATLALAVLRNQGGRRVPPPLQRMQSEDLLAAVFPDAAACLENIGGDREVPDHPLVRQTITDCLEEGMDLDGLLGVLRRVCDGRLTCVARDTPEPSALCAEILNAQPYAFLDDAPLEERRTQAVRTRRAFEPSSANELGALDADAITRVQDEAWPDPRDTDEMHDALLLAGFFADEEVQRNATWAELLHHLQSTERACRADRRAGDATPVWVATERAPELQLVFGDAIRFHPVPPALTAQGDAASDRESAVKELVRGRMEISGPLSAPAVANALGVDRVTIDAALMALEHEGVVLRGAFTPGHDGLEWCHRRLLSRIHRYTLNRLRAEIQPVAPAEFMRFLMEWQHVEPEHRMAGPEGLRAVITQLDGFELPAAAWETDVLSARVSSYDPLWLDTLCLTGAVTWRRLSPPNRDGAGPFTAGPVRSTPISLSLREHIETWHALTGPAGPSALSSYAQTVLPILRERGASFFPELVEQSKLLPTQVENALGELAAHGFVTSDSFAGLRILLTPSNKRPPRGGGKRRGRTTPFGVESAGRWSVTARGRDAAPADAPARETAGDDLEGSAEDQAWVLLRRYGVVFRRLLARETNLAPWRVLTQVLRRLEARGEIRGGRFVGGMSGEQFALPEAVAQLRTVRRAERDGRLIGISAADPLNLTGLLFPGHRVPALAGNRIVFRDGVPLAAREAGTLRPLADYDAALERDIERAIVRREVSPTLRAYLGRAG